MSNAKPSEFAATHLGRVVAERDAVRAGKYGPDHDLEHAAQEKPNNPTEHLARELRKRLMGLPGSSNAAGHQTKVWVQVGQFALAALEVLEPCDCGQGPESAEYHDWSCPLWDGTIQPGPCYEEPDVSPPAIRALLLQAMQAEVTDAEDNLNEVMLSMQSAVASHLCHRVHDPDREYTEGPCDECIESTSDLLHDGWDVQIAAAALAVTLACGQTRGETHKVVERIVVARESAALRSAAQDYREHVHDETAAGTWARVQGDAACTWLEQRADLIESDDG